MKRHPLMIVVPSIILALAVLPACASWDEPWDDWNCNLRVALWEVGGIPSATEVYFGVLPGATDDYDLVDSKMGACPMGDNPCPFSWFERPSWGQGPLIADWRAPIAEGTSKRWGTAFNDTWNIQNGWDYAEQSGIFDECFGDREFPIAGSVYLSWEFGISATPPAPLPPDDYTFTLIYRGGVNPKPPGTKLPDAMDPPAVGTSWDMEATPYIVVPMWRFTFQPYRPDCSDDALPDVAKFQILVTNPDLIPLCAITVDPSAPQEAPATFTFTGAALGDPPLVFTWDFGDGASDVGNPVSYTYHSGGAYLVTCTVTDANGDAVACTVVVYVMAGELCFPIRADCWNMITLPGDLVTTDPWEVFDELRPPNNQLDLLSGNLHRYDNGLQGYVTYYSSAPGEFGPLTPGHGYWLWGFADGTICYHATPWPQAVSVALPGPGWHIVGSPHDADLAVDETLWYRAGDGPHGFAEIMNLWVQDPLFYWSCNMGAYQSIGVLATDQDHFLRAYRGHWLYAFEDEVTMEVPLP